LIFAKIKGISLEKYDEKLLHFMKNFTMNAFKANLQANENKMSDTKNIYEIELDLNGNVIMPISGLYCVPIFWDILQDTYPFNKKITELAQEAFIETIVKSPNANIAILSYIYLCMENVKKNKSVCQSLEISSHLIQKYSIQQGSMTVACPHAAIKALDSKIRFIDLIVQSLVEYRRFSDPKLCAKEFADKIQKEVILTGKHTHLQHLNSRMKFLEFLLFSSNDVKLTTTHLTQLWMEFITLCKSFTSKKAFLRWLMFENEFHNIIQLKDILSIEISNFVFDQLRKNSGDLSRDFGVIYFKCFERYFLFTNLQLKNLEESDLIRVLKFEPLQGIEELWNLAVYNKNEKSRLCFAQLLINLYLYPSASLMNSRIKIWNDFITRIMLTIKEADKKAEDYAVGNLINFLLTFFNKLDGTMYIVPQNTSDPNAQYYQKIKLNLVIKTFSTEENREIDNKYSFEVLFNYSIGQLRKIIANKLGIHFMECDLQSVNKRIEHEENDYAITTNNYAYYPIEIRKIEPPMLSHEHPKRILAESHENIDIIFQLLAKENIHYANICWELLMLLPRNSKIENGIKNLEIIEPGLWNTLLDSNSVYKLLYALQIIAEIIKEPDQNINSVALTPEKYKEKEQREKWISDFLDKKGGNHLFYCLLSFPMHTISQPLSRKCFALLMKSIIQLFKNEPNYSDKAILYGTNKSEIIKRILTALEVFALPTIARKQTLRNAKYDYSQGEEEPITDQIIDNNEIDIKAKNEEAEGVTNGFRIIKSMYSTEFNYFAEIAHFSLFIELMKNGLICSENQVLRLKLSTEISSICSDFHKFAHFPVTPEKILPQILFNELINDAVNCAHGFQEFLITFKQIIEKVPQATLDSSKINFLEVIEKVSFALVQHKTTELTSNDYDDVLAGLLDLLSILLRKFPIHKLTIGQGPTQLLSEVLHKCLFDYPTSGRRYQTISNEMTPPKCKSKNSRKSAYTLLLVLMKDAPKNLQDVLDYLTNLHLHGSWRTCTFNEWEIPVAQYDKSATGYVGLKNLGCICYMNSLMQQLYMIPSFRYSILGAYQNAPISGDEHTQMQISGSTPAKNQTPTTSSPEKSGYSYGPVPMAVKDEMLGQLQVLFATLDESVRQYANPIEFFKTLRDYEGNPFDYSEQKDVDEFFSMLMDKIEIALKETNNVNTVKEHFEGKYVNQIIFKDCPHRKEPEEPFLAINLNIRNKRSLQECLESFVESEVMEGSNAINCERCDKKVSALKRVCIKTLPNNLIFVLKRFDYNHDTGQKVKLNDYCEFPMILNMTPYMVDSIEKKDAEQNNNSPSFQNILSNLQEASSKKPSSLNNTENEYRLVGIVIHSGIADSGHYYSFIKSRETDKDLWYQFNDHLVTPFDPTKIKEEAFGGEENWQDSQNKRYGKYEKHANAYMLFYERIEKSKSQIKFEIPPFIHNKIMQENDRNCQAKILLNEAYFSFVTYLSNHWNSYEQNKEILKNSAPPGTLVRIKPSENTESEFGIEKVWDEKTLFKCALNVFKYFTSVMLTTFMRSQIKDYIYPFTEILNQYMVKYKECAKWFLSEFSSLEVINEFLLGLSPSVVRLTIVGLLNTALKKVYEEEKSYYGTEKEQQSLVLNFVKIAFYYLHDIKPHKSYGIYYCQLLSKIALLGPEIRHHLLQMDYIKRILFFILDIDPLSQNVKPITQFVFNTDGILKSPPECRIASLRQTEYKFESSFLIHCLMNLVLSTSFTHLMQNSPLFQLPKETISNTYIPQLLCQKKTIETILNGCYNKLGQNSISKILAHICWESTVLKEEVRKVFMELLDECEYKEINSRLRPILIMSRYEDVVMSEFIQGVLKDINALLKKYQTAYYFIVYLTDYLIHMCAKSQVIMKAYKSQADQFDWLIAYFTENNAPPTPIPGWTIQYFKNPNANANVLARPAYYYHDNEDMKFKVRFFSHTLEKYREEPMPITQQEPDINSEIDPYEQTFSIGETVDYNIRTEDGQSDKWIAATVVANNGEFLQLQMDINGRSYYYWIDISASYVTKQGVHVIQLDGEDSATSNDNYSQNSNH